MLRTRDCLLFLATALLALAGAACAADQAPALLRVGIIGLDTSHVPAFTKLLNDPKATGDLAGFRVVAGFPGGTDIAASRDRVQGYTRELREMGIEIVGSIPELLQKVDVVLLESVDGRPHLEQVRPVFAAGKPVFIDKPLAGSLADAIAIDELGRRSKTPWFSSSSLRFCSDIGTMRQSAQLGGVVGCTAWSPCHIEPTHPDLYWYGVHGVEILYTVMGPGCQTVTRTRTDSAEVVTGVWNDGRVGTFRGLKKGKLDYGAIVFGNKAIVRTGGYDGYKGLVEQIGRFFRTHQPPVAHAETMEIMAFMEAADESKRQGGIPVKLETVIAKARSEAQAKLAR